MGFLDKLQQSAKETLDKGKEKLEDAQADRAADKLLRDLGAWYYASRTGRDEGAAAEHIERLIGELQAHEAQHGELGKDEPAAVPDPPAEPFAAPPAEPFAAAPPEAAPPTAAPVAPAAPADPAAPVTDGPPPPPPA